MPRWVLALTLLATLAHASTYVVSAGVETYEDERISGLKYAAADARSVAAVFRGAGVAEKTVAVLTNDPRTGERKATRSNLLAALERVREQATPEDHLVVFFAGHGVEQNGEQYLLTVDARRSLISDTALPLRLVGKALDGLQAKDALFLIDACRSDPQAGRADTDAKLSDGLARGLRPVLLPAANGPKPVVATLLACDVGQRAWEDPESGHGVFTAYLLRALGGEAAVGGKVTLTGLASYLQQKVGEWAERTKRPQRPRLVNPEGSNMLVIVPPAEPLVSVSFVNQPLAEVIDSLAQQYGVQVVLGQGVDGALRISGRLENQPLSKMLRLLLGAAGLTARKDGGVYLIEGTATAPVKPQPEPANDPALAEFTGPTLTVAQDGSGRYKTIGEAVAAAAPRARILIRPGTYRESLLLTRSVALIGEGGRDGVVIEAVGTSAVHVQSLGSNRKAVLRGLTLRHSATQSDAICTALTADGPGTTDAADCVLEARLTAGKAYGAAAIVTGSAAARFRGCEVRACPLGYAFQISNQAQVEAVQCSYSVSKAGAYALTVDASSTVRVTGCRFTGFACPLTATASTCTMADCAVGEGLDRVVNARSGARVTLDHVVANGLAVAAVQAEDADTNVQMLDCAVGGSPSAAIASKSASVTLRRCRLSDNASAVRLKSKATAVVENCEITGCTEPTGAFNVEPGCTLTERGNTLDPTDPAAQPTAAAPAPLAKFTGPTITVAADGSGQYRTMGEAVAKAPDGARILVKPGTYTQSLSLRGRHLAIVGNGPRERVRWQVDGDLALDVAVLEADQTVRLQGLTISATKVKRDRRFTIRAMANGGSFEMEDCQVSQQGSEVGLAVLIAGSIAATVQHCTFTDCDGGGLTFQDARRPCVVEDCEFGEFRSPAAFALHSGGTVVTVKRCRFAGALSGGLLVGPTGLVRVEDCEITLGAKGLGILADGPVEISGSRVTGGEISVLLSGAGQMKMEGCQISGASDRIWELRQTAVLTARRCRLTGPEPLVVARDTSQVVTENCTLSGSADQAFKIESGAKLTQTGNTFAR